jgi:hypothetical protein
LGLIGWLYAYTIKTRVQQRVLAKLRAAVETMTVPEPPEWPPRVPASEPEPGRTYTVPSLEALSLPQRRLLFLLYQEYQRSIPVIVLAGPLGLRYPAAEAMCEKMVDTGLITLTPGAHDSTSVSLTKSGRDYCILHGLDKTYTIPGRRSK